jgi:hypothetical protein
MHLELGFLIFTNHLTGKSTEPGTTHFPVARNSLIISIIVRSELQRQIAAPQSGTNIIEPTACNGTTKAERISTFALHWHHFIFMAFAQILRAISTGLHNIRPPIQRRTIN